MTASVRRTNTRSQIRPRDINTTSTTVNTIPDPTLDLPLVTKSLARIATHPTLSPFRRRVYRTLLSVPPGRWTTYAALSQHLGSGPRAIGNAMRTNPFAPAVPCHRVLASDRTLGGYKGAWNNGGEYAVEKRKLLLGEGVEFDERHRARGTCFVDFVEDFGETGG
jgi:methylated-DNA-[protein]-cysteine S-methyltransferase